jgi:hypothetical protein
LLRCSTGLNHRLGLWQAFGLREDALSNAWWMIV